LFATNKYVVITVNWVEGDRKYRCTEEVLWRTWDMVTGIYVKMVQRTGNQLG
jgi:hypothetical protein